MNLLRDIYTKSNSYIPIILILIIAFLLRFSIVMRGDEMFDEIAVVRNGEIYWGGIKNLDFTENIWRINYEHPPIAKYIYGFAGAIERNSEFIHSTFNSEFHPDKGYFVPKMFSVLMGLVNIFLVYYIAKRWFSQKAGIFSAAFMALLPHLVAHNAIAGLETPQALLSTLLVFFYIEGLFGKGEIDSKKVLLSFLMFVLLFMTKFSGAFYIVFYLFFARAYLFRVRKFPEQFIKIHLIGVAMFMGLLYLLWPWLWPDPINRLIESFTYFKNYHTGEYFFGSTGQPEWYYYFAYFLGTTPPVIVLLFLVYLWFIYKDWRAKEVDLKQVALIIWFISPFTISLIGLKQDGIRYVFSFLPAVSIIAGYSLWRIVKNLDKSYAWLVSAITFFSIIWSLVLFYPYYLDYYNYLFGGLRTVRENKTFDYGWWGEGINESVEYVNATFTEDGLSVLPLFFPSHTAPLFDGRFVYQKKYDLFDPPDILLISEYFYYYGGQLPSLDGYAKVHQVEVNNEPLVHIYSRVTE